MNKVSPETLRLSLMHEDAEGRPMFVDDDFAMVYRTNILLHADIGVGIPYRCDDSRLFIVTQGEMDITVNLLDYTFRAGTVGYFGRGCNIQVNSTTDDFAVESLLFKEGYLVDSSLYKTYYGKDTGLVMQVEEGEAAIISQQFATLWNLLQTGFYSKDVIVAMTTAIMHYVDLIRHKQLSQEHKTHTRYEQLLKEFVILVNANSGRERSLAFYAGKLCITEKHLCLVVKTASGQTPREWIDRAVVTNAKVLLKRTGMQVAQIADRMNFARSSAFCKYFKLHTGMTPQEYRDKQAE